MKLYIKNMVCNRCIMVVENVFKRNGLSPKKVDLGEVFLQNSIVKEKTMELINDELTSYGFILLDDIKHQTISQIKAEVIKWIQEYNFMRVPLKFSVYLEGKLKKDYTYLSNLFSSIEKQTVEQYLIAQRVEKVKELLTYDEFSLNEIAIKTGFSSGAHLSGQFKKITGTAPSKFKIMKENKRKPIDDL